MKTLVFFFLAISVSYLRADPPTPSPAQAPSAIPNNAPTANDWTIQGKTYHNVVVGIVEADRVHITYDGGIGTINLSDLPPDLQKQLGFDPQKAAIAQQLRAYEAEISDLKAENARLRSALSQYKGALAQSQDAAATPQTQPSRKGYIYFYNYIVNSGQRSTRGVLVNEFQKMTLNEKMVAVQQKWQVLSDDEKAAYEQKAQMYGTGPDPASPVPTDNQYNVNVTHDPNR